MSAQKITQCIFSTKKSCTFCGPGCDSATQRTCFEAERIGRAYASPCPAVPGGKCDIPRYRALLPSGKECGDGQGCNVRDMLSGNIPASEFEIPGIIRGNLPGEKIVDAQELKSILRECSK